ncbi:hypothetical protein [Nonomuraea rubra]|uniref:Arsenate reductase-like glutaredoxin family protein n=1 Tax=Nonomuraea rubra TaxID=46180 RepID=A0A7X0U626_9ACTN|nr:hypothetical protein [Nonomuraea rubra]MBB6556169.1 arsenate reductase-like glutaredoxin family protein [Nonomuraea rubra]
MADWAKLIEAIAGLVGAVAWPVAVVLAVWLIMRRHRTAFERLIDRVKSVSYPGGQIDLDAIESRQAAHVETLVEQVLDPDAKREDIQQIARQLAEDAEHLGRVRQAKVDNLEAEAMSRLIDAMAETPSAVMRAGRLLVVKEGGQTAVRHLTPGEAAFFDRHPELHRRPADIMALLALGQFEAGSEPGEENPQEDA